MRSCPAPSSPLAGRGDQHPPVPAPGVPRRARRPEEALAWGVKVTGCTVHLVDEQVDHGPIVAQVPVEVRDDDTRACTNASRPSSTNCCRAA
jgi:phosphoribosylglycinamide formyltransferase 1